ncbi:MAG: shikimate kinase [Bullifex sp.]
MNLFFTGMKHSGKTTFARGTAMHFSLKWADADDLILERIAPLSVREYYRANGKDAFMAVERDAVRDFVSSNDGYVLSLGGGAADNREVMDMIKPHGRVIYLTRDEDLILERIMKKGLPPFIDPNDPKGSFHPIFVRRDAVYRSCMDLEIPLGPYGSKEETLDMIVRKLEEAYGR